MWHVLYPTHFTMVKLIFNTSKMRYSELPSNTTSAGSGTHTCCIAENQLREAKTPYALLQNHQCKLSNTVAR